MRVSPYTDSAFSVCTFIETCTMSAPACHTRTCDQMVVVRAMSYRRCLEILQGEAYLANVDLNAVRRRDKRQTMVMGSSLCSCLFTCTSRWAFAVLNTHVTRWGWYAP